MVGLVVYFSHNLADVVISAEGDLVAIKGPDGRFYFNTLRRSKFDRKIWQQHFGQIEALSFRDFPTGQGQGITCDPLGCLVQSSNGIKLALSQEPAAFAEDCRLADIIITEGYAPFPCKDEKIVIDRTALRRGAGHALWFEGREVKVKTVTEDRGDRPWT